jgi:hypothetical protein
MAETIYLLCALTSLACAGLQIRSYARNRTRLLLWSSLCFTGLAANNFLLAIDRIVTPTPEFELLRVGLSVAAMFVLIFGLIWDSP